MGVYEFGSNIAPLPPQASLKSLGPELNPHISVYPTGLKQSSDVQGGRVEQLPSCCRVPQPEYVEEFLQPGFTALDEAMKMYFSGMRVPTKDSYRFLRIKVAGGDRSVLIWRDELVDGRIRLPVAAVNRTSADYNSAKFSTPLLAAGRRYTSNRMDRLAKIYRPVPFLVSYDLSVWAESKRDLEFILYQILIRFNPLAEFVMSDTHIQGAVQLQYGGYSDTSDKEASFDEVALKKYEFKMIAEAWLPLPEQIVPTVLGVATTVRENLSGAILLGQRGTSAPFFEPST